MRGDALLNLILANKEELVREVEAGGGLGCSGHEMMESRILRVESRAKSKITTLDFRRADFMDLLRRTPWHTASERRGVQESLLIFKDACSRLRNILSQWAGNQATKAQGLCGWTRSSWLKWNIKSKTTRHESRVRSPGRNIDILFEWAGNCNCCQVRRLLLLPGPNTVSWLTVGLYPRFCSAVYLSLETGSWNYCLGWHSWPMLSQVANYAQTWLEYPEHIHRLWFQLFLYKVTVAF